SRRDGERAAGPWPAPPPFPGSTGDRRLASRGEPNGPGDDGRPGSAARRDAAGLALRRRGWTSFVLPGPSGDVEYAGCPSRGSRSAVRDIGDNPRPVDLK